MKIGIITFHRATNYGAVLQSYSLVSYIKKTCPSADVEFIDYSTYSARISHIKTIVSSLFRQNIKAALGEIFKLFMFKRFSNSLPLSKFKIVSDDIKTFNRLSNKYYDIIIAGSDAIFSWSGKKFPTAYFLHDYHGKKLSYAASSHRLFYKDATKDKIKYILEAFESFNYLGVRDLETEKLIAYSGYTGEIFHNCDPTFLLDIGLIHSKVSFDEIKHKCKITRPFVVLMTPDASIASFVKTKLEDDFQIVSVFTGNKIFTDTVYNLTPFEWASLFSLAEFTITEYFHATILSLLNDTPVLAIDKLSNTSGYEGKIYDLMHRRLNLPELYLNVSEISKLGNKVLGEKIDVVKNFSTIEKIRKSVSAESKNSLSFTEALHKLITNNGE